MVDRLMSTGSRRKTLALPAAVAVFGCLVIWALFANPARAAEGVTTFEMTPTDTQAGGHPDVSWNISWKTRSQAPEDPCRCDDGRVIQIHSPTGFIGNPHVAPKCTVSEYNTGECPEESQVGVSTILGSLFFAAPVYNMETHPDQAGLIAFTVPILGVPVFIDLAARTESDYGLDSTGAPIQHAFPIPNVGLTLWGVPALPIHDEFRFKTPLSDHGNETGATSNSPPLPYLQNPTTCGVPLTASVDIEYYSGRTYHADSPYPSTTGCDTLSFNPSLTGLPTSTSTDSPSGIDLVLKVPQSQSPTTPTASQIRSTSVTLPEGVSLNPSAADGKVACSDGDSGIGTRHGATCPQFSKVGTVTLDSSALPGPIPGAIYLGEPKEGDPYRIILAADGFGTHVKVQGSVNADPVTGQLVASFVDLPQSPLSEFNMHFFGAERGLLATPVKCGTYEMESEFVPWNSQLPNQSSISFFSIDSGAGGSPCPGLTRPHSPKFEAGSSTTTAARHTSFSLSLTRGDGDQNLSGLTVTAPPGLSASLRGIPYCAQAAIDLLSSPGYEGVIEQASPACPAASQIGTATAAAGAGSRPVYVGGKVYLAGPYKGAPLSFLVVFPAVSGPYDLGTVAVRAAIDVDPTNAQVTAVSDPLPQILGGVPLRTRFIRVDLDRESFVINPTNCDPFSVDAMVTGDEGAVASLENHFQTANCDRLAYAPSLRLRLTGGLERRGHPAIHAKLTAGSGEANSRVISVTLPKGELLDNAHIGTICTRADFAKETCPAGSLIGQAEASTPLLDQPLKGNVYLRSSSNKLPDIAVDLKGQVDFVATARIDSVRGRLRTTFETVPDVPLGTVTLDLVGGSKGLINNSESLCGTSKSATARMTGQNGAVIRKRIKLQADCGAKSRNKRHQRRRGGHDLPRERKVG
jgi:hypothetical protein